MPGLSQFSFDRRYRPADSRSLPGSARLLLQRGVIQALDDKMPQAQGSFREASRNSPSWVLPWLCLGLTQLQTARLEDAIRSLQAGADPAKEDYRPHYLLGSGQGSSGRTESVLKRREQIFPALKQLPMTEPWAAGFRAPVNSCGRVPSLESRVTKELLQPTALQPPPQNPDRPW